MKKQIFGFTLGLLLCLTASAEEAEKQTNSTTSSESSVTASDVEGTSTDAEVDQTTTSTKKVKKSKAKGVKAANMAADSSGQSTADRAVVEDTGLSEGSYVGPTSRRKENLNRNNDMTASGTTQPRSTY